MMVSKAAVIALVLIVACPILLGYALNLDEVQVTEYKATGDPINVTPLLQSSTDYSYANADMVNMNSRLIMSGAPGYPDFATINPTKTSMPIARATYTNSVSGTTDTFSNYAFYQWVFDYIADSAYVNCTVNLSGGGTQTYTRVQNISYDYSESKLYVSTYVGSPGGWYISNPNVISNAVSISFAKVGAYVGTGYVWVYYKASPPASYVNLSDGFYANSYFNHVNNNQNNVTRLNLPTYTRNVMISLNLTQVSAANHEFRIDLDDGNGNYIRFIKTTVGSDIQWNVIDGAGNTLTDIYFDESRSANTYQLYMDLDGYDLKYIGDWPSTVGPANYYLTYSNDWATPASQNDLSNTYIRYKSPQMRIDAAEYRAYEYLIIEDSVYNPADFKTNPSTTINNPTQYGDSITFGGNTYIVSKGNITLGSKQIPVSGLVLSSSPTAGGYENKIGNTVVSVTANPSTITFNGKWSASIETMTMEGSTYTKTEWNVGQYAWNGIDDNFLMVGLLTSLGAFIALGIYIRRTKAALWPLLLVCGGAAILFFCML